MPRKRQTNARAIWQEFMANWSWFDTATGFVFGFLCGALLLHSLLLLTNLELWQVTTIIAKWAIPLSKVFGAVFFSARMWAIATYPRPHRESVNWEHLNAKQMLIMLLRDHYAALGMLLVAIIFAVSLAPDILNVADKIPSVEIK